MICVGFGTWGKLSSCCSREEASRSRSLLTVMMTGGGSRAHMKLWRSKMGLTTRYSPLNCRLLLSHYSLLSGRLWVVHVTPFGIWRAGIFSVCNTIPIYAYYLLVMDQIDMGVILFIPQLLSARTFWSKFSYCSRSHDTISENVLHHFVDTVLL